MSQVIIKTNSFHVTDETKYRKLIKQLIGETQDIRFRDMVEPNGKKRHSFAAFSEIKFLEGKQVSNLDQFFQKLQEILLSNEAVICMKLFNEDLGYVNGYVTMITSKRIMQKSLSDWGTEAALLTMGHVPDNITI